MLTNVVLTTLKPVERAKAILLEYAKCRKNLQYCIETYFTVMAGIKRIPFKLFPHQEKALFCYENFTNNITMKTRQMGFTTFTAGYIACKLIFNNNYKVVLISKTMKDSKDFLKQIKDILDEARLNYPWLVPDYVVGYNNKENFVLTNGSLVKAESTSDDAGRGTPGLCLIVVDEVAFIDRRSPGKMDEIWSAVSPALATTKGKAIMISTPKGTSGWYYETYTNAKQKGFHVIDAHWNEHPMYRRGMYKYVLDSQHPKGGYIKFLTDTWPDEIFDKDSGNYIKVPKESYPFIEDGKIRSPWYDNESRKLGPRKTKCELDCSFIGTGGEVIDSDTLRELQIEADNSKYAEYTMPFETISGLFKAYKEYIAPVVGRRYVLGADVATGDGSDYSAFGVIDVETLEIVATFKCQLLPLSFAKIISLVGKRYNNCVVIVENAGGGGTTLQSLKESNYPNIYYSILRKNDPSTGMKKRKLGLWPSEQVRWEGGDRLEEVILNRRLKIHCQDVMSELYTWIWDKDGKRRHAPEKHDDLIMGIQHAIYYIYYVIKRADKSRNTFKKVYTIERNGQKMTLGETNLESMTNSGSRGMRSEGIHPNRPRRPMITNIDRETGGNLYNRGAYRM
jgi:hypothetical protein